MRSSLAVFALGLMGCGSGKTVETADTGPGAEAVLNAPMLSHRYAEDGTGVIVLLEDGTATEQANVTGTQSARLTDGRVGVWATDGTLTIVDPTDWTTTSHALGETVSDFGACGDGLLAVASPSLIPLWCTDTECTEIDRTSLSGDFTAYFTASKVIGGDQLAYLVYVTSERDYWHRAVAFDCTEGTLRGEDYITVPGSNLISSADGWWLPYTTYDTRIDAGVKFYDPTAENPYVFETEHEGVIEDGAALTGQGLAYVVRDEDYGNIGGGDSTLWIVNTAEQDIEVGPIDDVIDKPMAWVQGVSADQTALWVAETEAITVTSLKKSSDQWAMDTAPDIPMEPFDHTTFLGTVDLP